MKKAINNSKKTKVFYSIVFNPKLINDIGNVMAKLDLGITGVVHPRAEEVSFSTTTKVTDKYIKFMAGVLRESYESTGNTVYDVSFLKKEEVAP